jgi:cytochrome c oxidase subunit 2
MRRLLDHLTGHDLEPAHEHEAGRSRAYPVLVTLGLLLTLAMMFAIVGLDWWDPHAPLDTFDPKGEWASKIMNLVSPVFILAGIVGVFVEGLIVYIVVKFRHSPDEHPEEGLQPVQSHGNFTAEVLWTVIPFLLLLGVAIPTVSTLFALSEREDDALQVKVVGQQWWWAFEYDLDDDGFGFPANSAPIKAEDPDPELYTANELVIPAGRQVELTITSQDVIHSFWIPSLNGKRDAVPGREAFWKIQADEPGRYRGQCTEFCGLSHARMQMYVIALPQDQFDEWVAQQSEDAKELDEGDFDSVEEFESYERGRAVFVDQCTTCHLVDGLEERDPETGEVTYTSDSYWEQGGAAQVSGTAPPLTHLMSREKFAGAIFDLYLGIESETPVDNYLTKEGLEVDYPGLEAWIRNPPAEKPMAPDPVIPNPHSNDPPLVGRGMPDLGLSEDQIDDLTDYLSSLK